jgi:hypothetical protein
MSLGWSTNSSEPSSANMRPSVCHPSKWNCGSPPECQLGKLPSVDSYRAQVSVRMLLEQHGFSGVELLGSDIPVKVKL